MSLHRFAASRLKIYFEIIAKSIDFGVKTGYYTNTKPKGATKVINEFVKSLDGVKSSTAVLMTVEAIKDVQIAEAHSRMRYKNDSTLVNRYNWNNSVQKVIAYKSLLDQIASFNPNSVINPAEVTNTILKLGLNTPITSNGLEE